AIRQHNTTIRAIQIPSVPDRKRPICLTTFRILLAVRFKWRTAKPLGPNTAPVCDEPTSRCQTSPSMWTLGGDQPVIPRVTFIRSEEHTSELQSRFDIVCRLLLEKKKKLPDGNQPMATKHR